MEAGRVRGSAGVAIALFAAFSISLSFVLAGPVYDAGMAPLALVALRPLVFVLVAAPVLRATGRPLGPAGRKRGEAWAIGLAYLAGTGGYIWAVAYLPVSLAVLIFYTYPLLTALLEAALARRAPRARDIACLLLAFAGLILALDVTGRSLDPRGIALALIGACGIAVSFTAMGRRLAGEDTLGVTFQMACSGALVAAVAAALTGSLTPPQGGGLAWLLLAGLLAAFVGGFFAMFRGVALIGPVRTSAIMNLEPVLTIALAALLLGQTLEPLQGAGAVLVIAAVIASQWRR